jgi:Xaa-Pro aminopeptidase
MTSDIGPISIQEYENRLQKVQEQLTRKGLVGLVAFSSYQEREGHVAYLTNHRNTLPNDMSHQGIGYAAAILARQGKPFLIAPGGYDAGKVTNICDVRIGEDLIRETAQALKILDLSAGKIGIAGTDVIPAEYYQQLKRDCPHATLCKADEIVENQRLIKSPAEIELLKRAAQLADGILKAGLDAIQPGVPSWQIEQRMCAAGVESGADFIPRNRVCFGKMTSHLNWKNADLRAVENGDYVLLEAAGWCAGYGFECKRVVVAGDRSKEQQDYLEHLAEAAEWMIATLKTNAQWTFFMAESRGREIHAVGNEIGRAHV